MPTYYAPGTRKQNRFYTVRGRIDGREHEVATKCRDKAGAEDYWHEFKRQIRAQRASLPGPGNATWLDASDLYRAARPDLSKNQLYYLRRLDEWFGATLVCEIDEADIHAAAHALYPAAKPQTRNRQAIVPAATVLRRAAKRKWCARPDIAKLPETEPDRPVVLPGRAQAVIDRAQERDMDVLAIAVETIVYHGFRISELLGLERRRVDWKACTLRRLVGKSGKWRTVSIDADIIAAWRRLPARADGRLFPWPTRFAFYREVAKLDLDFHWRPHMSRRGFATELKNRGSDTSDIAEAGQWEDPRSVEVYVADDLDRQRKTLSKLRDAKRAKKAG